MQIQGTRVPSTGPSDQSGWPSRGACRDRDPELFFPEGTEPSALVQAGTAKAVCRSCPVAGACLAWALSTRQSFGVWGGLTQEERRAVLGVRSATAAVARITATPVPSPAATEADRTAPASGQVLVRGGRRG